MLYHVEVYDAGMTITISSEDPRSLKAVQTSAEAGQWTRCRTRDGHKGFWHDGSACSADGSTAVAVLRRPSHRRLLSRPNPSLAGRTRRCRSNPASLVPMTACASR